MGHEIASFSVEPTRLGLRFIVNFSDGARGQYDVAQIPEGVLKSCIDFSLNMGYKGSSFPEVLFARVARVTTGLMS